jgi:RND family efflux transporter MFP subunit
VRLGTRRRGILTAVPFCVLTLGAACHGQTAEEVESTSAVTVKTVPATRGTIRGVVHATGIVNPAAGAELVVVAPGSARIAEMPYAAGDRVRHGDVLVRFEMPAAAADVQRQEAELARAEAALENAKAAQARARELFDRGVAARREVEDANRSLADASAGVAGARASLAAAQTVAARAAVRATFNGIIAKRYHNPGDLVEATASDPVLRVIDPDRLEVVASVPLADASRVEIGARARLVSAPAGPRVVELKVLSRPAAVDSGTATVPVRLAFAVPVQVPVGAPAQVDIEAEQHQDVVLVPAVALVREGEETAVFVAREGKAHRRPIQVGLTDGTSVEVVSGVTVGERVIVDGQAGLPDNAAVIEGPTLKATTPDTPAEKDGPK